MDKNLLLIQLNRWFQLAEENNWESYDPFDILLSPYFVGMQSVSPLLSRIIIQFGKRSGNKTRRLLRISPHQEATTLSDFLQASMFLDENDKPGILSYRKTLVSKLREKAIPTANGLGWGLEFQYTSRFVNALPRTPNSYTTVNVVNSLMDLFERTRNKEACELALLGSRFITMDLGDFEFKGRPWFEYWPKSKIPAINIQALIALMLVRIGKTLNDSHMVKLADQCVDTVLDTQQKDGSWQYCADGSATFIDGFHTGFILQGLTRYLKYRKTDNQSIIANSIKKGFDFFKQHLITRNAMPRYLADKRVSTDGQNFAQCIQTFLICAEDNNDIEMAVRLWENMTRLNVFQKSAHIREKRDYLFTISPDFRWVIGPTVLAAAYLLKSLETIDN